MHTTEVLVLDSIMGSGKAQPLYSKVLTENGFIEMKDIKVGDKIFGDDGFLHVVNGVFPQGKKDIYEIEFSDGSKTRCCDEHLWTYQLPQDKAKNKFRTDTLKNIMKRPLYKITNRNDKNWQVFIPMCKPINFLEKKISIDPWLLGVLLGDGCFRGYGSIQISNNENDILNKIECILKDMNIRLVHTNKYDYRLSKTKGKENILKHYLRKYNLLGKKSNDKFIPKDYLINSVSIRLDLLRGLIDTDGYVSSNGTIDYCTSSEQLAKDVKFLVESLGGTVKMSNRIPKYKYNNECKEGKISYRLNIKSPKNLKFYSSEKHTNKVTIKRQRESFRHINKISYIGKEECQCLMIMSNSHLYITDDFIVTHNTSYIIDYMNTHTEETFIYISPYLSEVDRVINNCPMRYFEQPQHYDRKSNKVVSKYENILNILTDKLNVASTHALFKTFNEDVINILSKNKYTLVMDEVVDVVEQIKISKDDIKLLRNNKVIEVDENGRIHWIDDDYIGEFSSYKNKIKNGEVYLHNEAAILWTFPVEIFKYFNKIIISTYLFRGQIQCYYYQMHNIQFKYKSVESYIDNGETKFRLCDYRQHEDLNHIKKLINLYAGKLNDIGKPTRRTKFPLSKSWYDKANKEKLMIIKNNTYNYFRHICKTTNSASLWTTFKDRSPQDENETKPKTKVTPLGYKNSYVPCTMRATNEYKDRSSVAYLINRFENPIITSFLSKNGAEVNQDIFALSELIQFIWRSQIRDGKPINLYIPSERMRMLLIEWLNGNI